MSNTRPMLMPQVLTVGELRREIDHCADDVVIDFGTSRAGASLRWYRFTKSDGLLQVELIEDTGDDS